MLHKRSALLCASQYNLHSSFAPTFAQFVQGFTMKSDKIENKVTHLCPIYVEIYECV